MEKVLITGASGFVGSFLVTEFLERGYEVHAAVRKSSDLTWLQDDRINFFFIDFEQPDSLRQQLIAVGFDYIVHNAGVTKADHKSTYFKVNATYTQRLAELSLSLEKKPKKFLFVSSLAAYGPADQHEGDMVVESFQPRPITTYGESKLAAEKAIKALPGLPYIIIRPTAVYGPREKDILTFFSLVNSGLEPYIGFSQQQLTFIYVRDLVRGIADLTLSNIQQKAYFISDGNCYSAQELGKWTKLFLDKKTLKVHVPLGVVRVFARFSEAFGKISGKSPPLNLEKVRELESLNWKCDIRALKEDIGFQPTFNLEAGLRETINWYQQHNWL